MTHPKSTDERIVAAAIRLFSRHGFQGTTTREIARVADVNETTVFRHFPRKVDLFWAAVETELAGVRLGHDLEIALTELRSPQVVLPLLFELMVTTALYQPELMRLLIFSALELRPTAERVFRKKLGPLCASIVGYLDRCVDNGEIRPVDTLLTLIALMTTPAAHHSLHELFTGTAVPYATTQEAVAAYSEFWLAALLPSLRSVGASGREISRMQPAFPFLTTETVE